MSSSATTRFVSPRAGSVTARTTVATTRMRIPKSAVRIFMVQPSGRRYISTGTFLFTLNFSCASQLYSSVRPPGSSAASTIACVCRSRNVATESTTAATTAMNSTVVSFSKVTLAKNKNQAKITPVWACFQKCHLPYLYAKNTSSSAPTDAASAPSSAATTSMTAKTTARMRSTAIRKVRRTAATQRPRALIPV